MFLCIVRLVSSHLQTPKCLMLVQEAVQGAFNLFGAAPVATGTEAGTKEEA